MNPLFSILIANYNNGKYIAECLDSVLNQDYPNIEIILVDDGSTDDSLKIIQPYLAQNIKLFINETNNGVGFTKNRCIEESNGEICGFVDPDDTITSTAIGKMVVAHLANPGASLVYSSLYYCDEQLKITSVKKLSQVPLHQYNFFNQNGDISAFCAFKKAAYLKTLGIDPSLKNAEDQDLYLKLYDVGECILVDEPLYHYRIHSGGLSTLNNADKSFFWRWKVIMKRADEKNIDIESDFLQTFVRRERVKHWLKIDHAFRKTWLFKIIRKIIK